MSLLENERELQSRTNKVPPNHRQDQGTKERHAFLRRKGVSWEGCYELNKSTVEETEIKVRWLLMGRAVAQADEKSVSSSRWRVVSMCKAKSK